MKTIKFASLFCCMTVLVASGQTPSSGVQASLTLHADQPGPTINRNIYGQFAEHLGHCIYGGIWVGEDSSIPNTHGYRNDVLEALKKLQVPVLRWPGGCFADEYHWKDGIGPMQNRPAMINTHWGGVVENNHFGTHEFLNLCEMLDIAPYVCGNVGSGSVQELMEWVEYMTSDADSPMANLRRKNGRDKPWKVPYIAVGNESWGCGGNMRPEYYADLYRRYNTFIKNYIPGRENRIFRVAGGPNAGDYNWTEVLMKQVGRRMDGLSMHYYTIPSGDWGHKGSATQFGEDQYFSTLRNTLQMEDLIKRHSAIMDVYDAEKRVGLVVDEWGVWTDVEPGTNPGFLFQQNSLRDAILAALNFDIFHRHADRVVMANIAQMVNVLQAMILTDNEKMLLTPTYHVFEMYKVHQDATFLPVNLQSPEYRRGDQSLPAVDATASRNKDGIVHLSLVNTDPNHQLPVVCKLASLTAKSVNGRILTADTVQAHNTFDQTDVVHPVAFTDFKLDGDTLTVQMPSKSVAVLELQ